MLPFDSPRWATLSHAYGNALDVPQLIAKLRTAGPSEWEDVMGALIPAILHQGDVYTATYAAVPHLLEHAAQLGPCKQSEELLDSIAYAARGGNGPQVPEFLEEAWEDAQDDARELILERLISGLVSESYANLLIAGLLDLSGESDWAEHVRNWARYSIKTQCAYCDHEQAVLWDNGRTRHTLVDRSIHDFDVTPSSELGIRPDDDLEFDEDQISGQLIGLAASTGYGTVEDQMRHLFGHFVCGSCGNRVSLTLA
jgi:hypothetical protein